MILRAAVFEQCIAQTSFEFLLGRLTFRASVLLNFDRFFNRLNQFVIDFANRFDIHDAALVLPRRLDAVLLQHFGVAQ